MTVFLGSTSLNKNHIYFRRLQFKSRLLYSIIKDSSYKDVEIPLSTIHLCSLVSKCSNVKVPRVGFHSEWKVPQWSSTRHWASLSAVIHPLCSYSKCQKSSILLILWKYPVLDPHTCTTTIHVSIKTFDSTIMQVSKFYLSHVHGHIGLLATKLSHFFNNPANYNGNNLYGGLLDRCRAITTRPHSRTYWGSLK